MKREDDTYTWSLLACYCVLYFASADPTYRAKILVAVHISTRPSVLESGPFGEAKIVIEGSQLTVVSLAKMLLISEEAINELSNSENYSIELIDPRCVSPLDYETIVESVKKTGRLLIIDEEFEPCSIASQISSKIIDIAFDYLDAPIKLINGSFSPTPYSPSLEKEIIPSKEIIKQKIVEILNE